MKSTQRGARNTVLMLISRMCVLRHTAPRHLTESVNIRVALAWSALRARGGAKACSGVAGRQARCQMSWPGAAGAGRQARCT
eukprot:283902-Alexandrium_andersonii.AAC.1